jgi:FKBP-type peptidyl-prolyl cis-trans isomerase SlyD
MQIQNGNQVKASYTFTDESGTLLASSEQNGPMVYVQGQGAILPGIEQALAGRQEGDEIQLTLPPEQAYGAHRPELVFEAPLGNLPEGVDLNPGAEFYSGMGDRPAFSLRVLRETENGVLLDGNHPLAGKTLHAQLRVLSIQ